MQVRFSDRVAGIVIVVLLFSSIVFDRTMTYTIEEDKRQQARYNLEHVNYCFHSARSHFGMEEALRICTTDVRTTHTGDVYVLDFNTLEFVFENSTDVPNGNLYFTEESVGKHFKDWPTGEAARDLMLLGKDSEPGLNSWYQFDSGVEWLEWKIIPHLYVENQNKYVIVQGIQKDEVYERYKYIRILAFSIITLVVLLLLSSIRVRHRRD